MIGNLRTLMKAAFVTVSFVSNPALNFVSSEPVDTGNFGYLELSKTVSQKRELTQEFPLLGEHL